MKIDTSSIFLKNKGDQIALLFHGLAGCSFELRGLADFLFQNGISVYAPTLSFHESRNLDDLKNASLNSWKEDANDAYKKISGFRKIYVGGISNGSSLASYLALQYKPAGLISICPPIIPGFSFFRKFPLRKMLKWFNKYFEYIPRFDYKMVRDWTLAKSLPRFKKLPSHFPYDSLLLSEYIRKNLSKIETPILIIQSKYDNRVDPKGAEFLFHHIRSSKKKIYYAENSGHVVLLDVDRKEVFKEIAEFIKSL